MHEWRKRAKDLWYHLRILDRAAPSEFGDRAYAEKPKKFRKQMRAGWCDWRG